MNKQEMIKVGVDAERHERWEFPACCKFNRGNQFLKFSITVSVI